MKERTTDLVLRTIKETGVRHVFGITGGAITNQLDAFSRDNDVQFISMVQEQGAAMAVEAYSRLRGYGVAMATSGPGGTNLVTGIAGCYMDSIPALFITGQVSRFDLRTNNIRQKGFQELNMCGVISPVTKYSQMVMTPDLLPEMMGEAMRSSLSGRMGPVHLDIPMDIQQVEIESVNVDWRVSRRVEKVDMTKVKELISRAERPVLILGNGVRLGEAGELAYELATKLKWPVFPSWAYADFLHENRIDLFGVYGNRGANFGVQNSDLILSIGSRLDTRMTGSKPVNFAREAKKIIVDIDKGEIMKGSVVPDLPIETDARSFITSMLADMPKSKDVSGWLKKCREWRDRYPNVTLDDFKELNPYSVSRIISNEAKERDIIVPESGGNLSWIMQSWEWKRGQRLVNDFGNSSMGYSLPAAIGAYFATGRAPICIAGDGGIQMNIQELQTIVNYKIPIKIFVYSNEGYGIIRQFQDLYLGGRHVGTHEGTPDFAKVAEAYGIKAMRIDDVTKVKAQIKEAMNYNGAILVDIRMNPNSIIKPRAIFGKPIEEQHPFLTDEETNSNLIVKRWQT